VKQDEAAANLGYELRSLILDMRALFPFLYLGLSAGVLSVTTVVHSVPCGWIKLCVRTVVDIWLLSVCKNEFATLEGGRILYLPDYIFLLYLLTTALLTAN
jgi:hypothetical protein